MESTTSDTILHDTTPLDTSTPITASYASLDITTTSERNLPDIFLTLQINSTPKQTEMFYLASTVPKQKAQKFEITSRTSV